MGQARRRGTREERIQQAIERNEERDLERRRQEMLRAARLGNAQGPNKGKLGLMAAVLALAAPTR